ncbi:16S rRNA (guanine(966)-N(2))-methyltransferase RsmD [Synechococcus sp. FGCU-3]|nr:16S rRNA (guanine(966)-N(2))-methyltransferase RsmD [Synechococcus sp. FGCU3]
MSLRLSGGRKLQSPPGLTARPTPARVRQAVMNMLAAELPGSRWLDLCSGSGVMACEALQRGAKRVVAVEHDRRHAAVAQANLQAVAHGLGDRQVQVRQADVRRWLQVGCKASGEEPFDLIYADPPYASGLYRALADAVLQGHWLVPGGQLLLECSSNGVPEIDGPWDLIDQRRYGTTTVMRLEQR